MFKIAKPLFLHVLTSLHAGSGSDLGIVDLPIQRERHTGFPKIESSSLKGSIREAFERKFPFKKGDSDEAKTNRIKLHLTFGFDELNEAKEIADFFKESDNSEFAGALGFTDARLLLFPVKSMKGVFAWITCMQVLERFIKDLGLCQNETEELLKKLDINFGHKKNEDTLCSSKTLTVGNKIILEEYTFTITEIEKFKTFAFELSKMLSIPEIAEKLVLLPDDDFREFVELSTEVITRTKINNETGTVQEGALFTEEYLPPETIMYSLVLASPIFNKVKMGFNGNGKPEEELVMEYFVENLSEIIQIGGNATIGKGIVSTKVLGKEVK